MRLPAVSTAFRWSDEPWGPALRCVRLEARAQHVFTTRQLQLRSSDDERAWQYVAASVGGTKDRVLRVNQVHGKTVRIVRACAVEDGDLTLRPQGDAVISDVPGAVLAVQVADCVPMLIADPRQGVAGAIHAGWRGTCAGIGAATIAQLVNQFGCLPKELHVALGPSIGACCYEVGDELLQTFVDAGATQRELARWFTRTGAGSLRLDLWAANREQLIGAGVDPDRIYLSRLCTQTHVDVFESYRVEGACAGRMVAAIRVPTPSGSSLTRHSGSRLIKRRIRHPETRPRG